MHKNGYFNSLKCTDNNKDEGDGQFKRFMEREGGLKKP